MSDPIITFDHVVKEFKTRGRGANIARAVDDVSLTIDRGDIFGIIGYSGAGKSTLVRLINALERPTSGAVTVLGTDITSLSETKLRPIRQKIGMIFQQFNLFSTKTVAQNIAYPLQLDHWRKDYQDRRVNELLEFVGLSEHANKYPSQLSGGGQQQRVGIARALATNPEILLADEATSALDPETTTEVLALLKRVNEEFGITIVLITHQMNVVQQIAGRVAVMSAGRAVDSGDVILAEKPGVVTYVSADIIRTMNDDGTTSSYKLAKFQRSNQTTCYNQVPLIHDGERVEAGTVLADGPATQKGEMALGKNLLIAFMPWNGYNYEDAVIISQRLVQDDTLSSIHIEEYEIDARETKLGAEEITRDLPNVGEDAVANLDERGIIRIGAEVEAGDILVGKVTPKGETELTAEERLLRAIFGEKSREVRDTSLRVPHGETGTVIAVKEITREDAEEDGDELPNGVNQMIRVYIAQHRKITQGDKLSGRHGNKGVISRILPEEDMPFLADGTPVDIMLNPLGVPSRMNLGQVLELHLGWIAHAGWDISLDPDAEAAWKKYVPQGAEKGAPGTPVATPVFDGVRPETIKGLLSCTLPDRDGNKLVGPDGKATLFDGRTGEPFPKPISVGYMYMLKLHHLVDDKIHARSTGPYSSRWAARLSSAASASARWKCGPSRPTVPPTRCTK